MACADRGDLNSVPCTQASIAGQGGELAADEGVGTGKWDSCRVLHPVLQCTLAL